MIKILIFFLISFSYSQIFSVDTRSGGEPGKTYIVSGSVVNIRKEPDQKSAKITSIAKGQKVQFIEENVGEDTIDAIQAPWVKVKLQDGKEGWMFGGYLTNPGESKPAIGYQCINFKKDTKEFLGGCADIGSKGVQDEGECLVDFGKDKKLHIRNDTGRVRVSGTWELQGDKVIGTIIESSKDELCIINEQTCEQDQKNTYGKDNIVLTSKIIFSINNSNNTVIGKASPAKDAKPIPKKSVYKSKLENVVLKCIIPY